MTSFLSAVASAPTPLSACPASSGRPNSFGLTCRGPTKSAASKPNTRARSNSSSQERPPPRAERSFPTSLPARPPRNHHCRNPAARTEFAFHFGPHGLSAADDILQHLIHDVLLEDAEVAIRLQIFF